PRDICIRHGCCNPARIIRPEERLSASVWNRGRRHVLCVDCYFAHTPPLPPIYQCGNPARTAAETASSSITNVGQHCCDRSDRSEHALGGRPALHFANLCAILVVDVSPLLEHPKSAQPKGRVARLTVM